MNQNNIDILPLMAPFFDVHMTLQLLNFAVEKKVYNATDVTETKIKLVESTNMIDLLIDELKASGFKYHKTIPELEAKKNEIFNALQVPNELVDLIKFFNNEESFKSFRLELNKLDFLMKNVNANLELLTKAYQFAKVQYEAGMYTEAYPILNGLIYTFSQKTGATYPPFYEGALWGRLACVVYMKVNNTSDYIHAIQAVKSFIEFNSIQKMTSPSETLKQRAWLLHWSLFIYFSPTTLNVTSQTTSSYRCENLLDLFMDRNYLIAIENYSPWLLRYIVMAVILNPNKRKNLMKDLLNEINLLKYSYSDKLLTFFTDLYTNFNLESSYKLLLECKDILQNDFFCSIFEGQFYLQARQLILEMYCLIYRDVSLETITSALEIEVEALEPWALELVNSTKNTTHTTSITSELSNRISYINTAALPWKYQFESHRELVAKTLNIKALYNEINTEQSVFIKAKNK